MNIESKKTILIACSMLRDEIEQIMRDEALSLPVVYLEKGLHDRPELLRQALQAEIDKVRDFDLILLAYGLCGNSTVGLRSEIATLAIFKFDDCIRMLMSTGEFAPPRVEKDCLYYTKQWMESDRFILKDRQSYIEKYGEEMAAYVMEEMLKGYRGLKLIDDGTYAVSDCTEAAKEAAHALHLEFETVKGTTRGLKKLLTGRFDSEICVVPPEETVTEKHFSGRPL